MVYIPYLETNSLIWVKWQRGTPPKFVEKISFKVIFGQFHPPTTPDNSGLFIPLKSVCKVFGRLWKVSIRPLNCVHHMSEWILEFVLKVSGRNIDGVWKASWWCLGDAWKLFGRFGKGVWKVSETDGVFEVSKSFCHWGGFSEFFTRFSFDSKLSTNQFFLPWKSFCSQMNECKYANMVCKYAIIQFCKKITKVFWLEYAIMQLFTPYFGLLYCN